MTLPSNFASLLLIVVATIAEPAAPALRSDAAALIDALRAGDWLARQQAEDDLVALGVDAIPAIEAAARAESTDFESRDRLLSALDRIRQERLIIATRITVQKQFDSPLAAFAHLAEFVGLTAEPESDAIASRAAVGPVALDLSDAPWLAAVRDLTARTGIAAEVAEPKLRLLEQPPEARRPPTDFTGSIAVTATGARQVQTLQLGDGSRRGDVVLSLAVELEPKTVLVDSTARLRISQLKDGAGKAFRQNQLLGLTRRGPSRYSATLTLGAPGKAPAAIGLLAGELQAEVITRIERLQIDDLTTLPRLVSLASGEAEIGAVERTDKGHTLLLVVSTRMIHGPAGQQIGSGKIDGLRILDQHGNPMSIGPGSGASRGALFDYRFPLTSPDPTAVPTRISWTIAAQTRDVSIPFKLENLSLPE